MISFDELGTMLDDVTEEIPEAFFRELNGGIILSPDKKYHPESGSRQDLYIMGEYHNDRKGYGGLGRYIILYYGSFIHVYGHTDPGSQREELRKILLHEFTHHLESLAGERDLEIKDARNMALYKRRFYRKKQP